MADAAGNQAPPPELPAGPAEGDDDHVDPRVLRRFELSQKLGHSPWGVVWRAVDKGSRKPVALKKLFDAMSSRRRAQMAFREANILARLRGTPHVVELLDVLGLADERDMDVYLVLQLSRADLFDAIRFRAVKPKHHAFIIAQVMRGLTAIHAHGIVHRDIKPSNLLIDERCHVQICDFGHARSVLGMDAPVSANNSGGSPATDYLGSRWYRPPESLVGSPRLSTAVDVWGAGCVLGELLLGKALFQGSGVPEQLNLIMQFTGVPSETEISALQAPFAHEQLDPSVIGDVRPRATSEFFDDARAEALDVLRLCLQFAPDRRTSAAKVLTHPYVIEYHHDGFEALVIPEQQEALPLDDNIVHDVCEYRLLMEQDIERRERHRRRVGGSGQGRFGYGLGYL